MSDSKNKKEAYRIVLDDLMLCDLFRGRYDAKHGASEHYMYGICTVMEAIAYRVSEETGDAFSDMFLLTMIKSEEKYEAMSKHTETHEKRTKTHCVCSDAISRQAAIDAIEHVTWYHQNRNGQMVSGANSDEHQAWYKAEDVYEAIEALPSASKSGHWMMNPSEVAGDGYYICSNCNNDVYDATDFCPNCGSYNGGESDDKG